MELVKLRVVANSTSHYYDTLYKNGDRPSGTPTDIVIGNQLEWNNSDVTIRDDLSAYLADGILPPQTIPYRIHDGTEWGTTGTLTISTSGVPGIPSIPSRSTSLVTRYTAVSNSIH